MILPASCTGSHRKKGSTPASGAKVRFTGKFQGLMIPTTPLGW